MFQTNHECQSRKIIPPVFFISCTVLSMYFYFLSLLQFSSRSDLGSHSHLVETQWPSMLGGICTVTRAPLWRRFSMFWHCVSLGGQLKLFSRARRGDRPSATYRDEPTVQPAEHTSTSHTIFNLLHIKALVINWDLHAQHSQEFTHNDVKNKKQ